MFDIKETAVKLGIAAITLRRYIKANMISYRKVGRIYRFTQNDIDEYIEQGKVEAKANAERKYIAICNRRASQFACYI
jgi:excisionase family DNA binding protein